MGKRRLLTRLAKQGVPDRVLEAMYQVRRAAYVPEGPQSRDVWQDRALPIGSGQTISQPSLVATTLAWLDVRPGDTVLEVGTGSGYVVAVLATMGARVWTIERHEELSLRARRAWQETDVPLERIRSIVGDGSLGWPGPRTFDRILVSAAAPSIPGALVEQLADGGRMIVPVGDRHRQKMVLVQRRGSDITTIDGLGVAFVPLVGAQGHPS